MSKPDPTPYIFFGCVMGLSKHNLTR